MITLDQAKGLKPDDLVVVTRTKEVWTVTSVIDNNKSVVVNITNGLRQSYFNETRLALFDLYETPNAPSNLPSAQEAADQLRPGFDAAFHEFDANRKEAVEGLASATKQRAEETGQIKEIPEEEIRPRIEEQFLAEPELQKPARKAKQKKAK